MQCLSKVCDIRPIAEPDIARLEQRFQEGRRAKHADRWLQQQRGQAIYLIAWSQEQPVGHAWLNWAGPQDEPVARQLPVACPNMEDFLC